MMRTPLGGLIENAVLIQLLSGESASKHIGTWKKGTNSDIEVDFIYNLPELGLSLPVECKAALRIKRKHYKNIIHYLELTGQPVGILVSAAPLQILTVNDKSVINIPVYLANKPNIQEYARRSLHRP